MLGRRQLLAGSAAASLACVRRAEASDLSVTTTSIEARARWLAGAAPLPGVEPTAEWSAYARAEEERWKAAQPRINVMREWASRELMPLVTADQTLFYPFAGPDALHAIALFGPRRMMLVGLEPIGTLPANGEPPGYFRRLGTATGDLHKLGFFRTREMSADFQREGVIAALVAAIVRMGGRVRSVQAHTSNGPPTARIDWAMTATGSSHRLEYVQLDLANLGMKDHAAFLASVHALAPFVTFVKAGMYLLAEARFSNLRQMLLSDSAVVVQDDTGIPFRQFEPERWATRFFGRYETPLPPFEDRAQPALKEAYEHRVVRPLPFGVGYAIEARRSNLLIASRVVR